MTEAGPATRPESSCVRKGDVDVGRKEGAKKLSGEEEHPDDGVLCFRRPLFPIQCLPLMWYTCVPCTQLFGLIIEFQQRINQSTLFD